MKPEYLKKGGLILLIGLLISSFFYFDMSQYLNIDFLKSKQAFLKNYYASHLFATIAIYMLIYITVTALSIPGALVLTLAGGAIFGLWVGTLIVSFASTIGATCAFFASRYLFKDYVQNRFGDKLLTINENLEKDGAFYLFTLRLVPVFPFFVINLVMGLTPIKMVTFYLFSQAGMLAGTFLFVNAGTQLASPELLSGKIPSDFLIAFVLLGIFPLIVKKCVEYIKARKL